MVAVCLSHWAAYAVDGGVRCLSLLADELGEDQVMQVIHHAHALYLLHQHSLPLISHQLVALSQVTSNPAFCE